jgi:hypothetical protein
LLISPFSKNEDNADEFPFCPALGSNTSFAASHLLTMPPDFDIAISIRPGGDLTGFAGFVRSFPEGSGQAGALKRLPDSRRSG